MKNAKKPSPLGDTQSMLASRTAITHVTLRSLDLEVLVAVEQSPTNISKSKRSILTAHQSLVAPSAPPLSTKKDFKLKIYVLLFLID